MQKNISFADTSSLRVILEEKIARFARVPHYVLITGERGTGKTTIAKKLHESGLRSKGDFISVNCASFTADLLESELFGYEKGAFTGAGSPKAGLFEAAAGGTLFLDEVGELSLSLQSKILKAVEEKRIRRVGGTLEREIDVRIIAATSRNLQVMVQEGSFRADLYDRLNILQLETVPLRYQKEVIRDLFLRQMDEERASVGRAIPFVINEDAIGELQQFAWKGNYRELRNFATRLAVESIDAPAITIDLIRNSLHADHKTSISAYPCDSAIHREVAAFDDSYDQRNLVTVVLDPEIDDLDSVYVKAAGKFIEHALSKTNGNLRRAARSMGTTHSTLSRILKKHKERDMISVPRSKSSLATFAAA